MNLKAVLEGLLFVVGDDGLTIDQVRNILDLTEEDSIKLISELRHDYDDDIRGIRIEILGNSFKLTTKKEHREYYKKLVEEKDVNGLSQAALETLVIVAYNEPITRIKVDEIRGIYSGQLIRKLVAKGLIKETGREDCPGKPIIYKTTNDFLDYFGLSSKEDLPKIDFEFTSDDTETDLFKSKYTEEEIKD